jgi:hypothetical protein
MEQPLPNSVVTKVTASTSSILLSAPSKDRPWAAIYNNASSASLYLKLGENASNNSFTLIVSPQGYYEIPHKYTGPISGSWSAVDGYAMVTELMY